MKLLAQIAVGISLISWNAGVAQPTAKAFIAPAPTGNAPGSSTLTLESIWRRHDAIAISDLPMPQPLNLNGGSHEFIGRAGNRVCGWDMGEPDRPVVLWWTGGPGEPFGPKVLSWSSLDLHGFRHICIDTPGAGEGKSPKSEWRAGWRPEDQADDAATFLRVRGVKRKVIVLGWSWGSTMALLFAQRHPDLCEGVVAGGVWANTSSEVRRYLGTESTRSWIPGLDAAFERVVGRRSSAIEIHRAIKFGRGGKAFAKAYVTSESGQALPDYSIRGNSDPALAGSPYDHWLAIKSEDPDFRLAHIESEMMARGEAGQWRLRFNFSPKLAGVPMILIQGRFDQVCDPDTARHVYAAWPGSKKLLVPMNIGHWNPRGATNAEFEAVGIDLSMRSKFKKLNALHWGSASCMMAAGVETIRDLIQSSPSQQPAPTSGVASGD